MKVFPKLFALLFVTFLFTSFATANDAYEECMNQYNECLDNCDKGDDESCYNTCETKFPCSQEEETASEEPQEES